MELLGGFMMELSCSILSLILSLELSCSILSLTLSLSLNYVAPRALRSRLELTLRVSKLSATLMPMYCSFSVILKQRSLIASSLLQLRRTHFRWEKSQLMRALFLRIRFKQ
jgi:acyl-coenzyme A thioesterase PaaI-like protein